MHSVSFYFIIFILRHLITVWLFNRSYSSFRACETFSLPFFVKIIFTLFSSDIQLTTVSRIIVAGFRSQLNIKKNFEL